MPAQLPSLNTYRARLREALDRETSMAAVEAYVMATTDVDGLDWDGRHRLDWILKSIVWPVTRRRPRRKADPDQGLLF